MYSKLNLVAATTAAYIEADPQLVAHDGLPAIDALLEEKGNLNTTVSAALQKLGLAVLVIVSDVARDDTGEAKGFSEARIIVEVAETYATNKTGRRCLAVAERIAHCCHGRENGLGLQLGRARTLRLEPGPNLRLVPHLTQVIRHVTFVTDVMI